jgi:hypothetical protein
MVFCGDFGWSFSASKRCHFLKIFLWIFWLPFGGANRVGRGTEDLVTDWRRRRLFFKAPEYIPLALLGVS